MKRIKIYFFDLMIILAELVIGFLLIISPEGFTPPECRNADL